MSQFAVILPAAGQSRRFGGLEKKPFVSLQSRPVWQRSAELFWNRPDVSQVLLVLDPQDQDEFRSRFGHLLAFTNVTIVNGGHERFASVANALEKLNETAEFVAIHDAVRPLCPPRLVDAVFCQARATGAALAAIPVADTLKRVEPTTQQITDTLPRAGLWQAQTPQAFRRDWLVAAYARRGEYAATITDDAQLLEALGHPVTVVPGSPRNFKITTPDDFQLAQALLGDPQSQEGKRPVARFGESEAIW
ncbi:MAG: 2-C-methyl-D-erythritol 4-phosphate cytidylyltransferase [Bacteroidales bacterium]|nr:2-C-methyl-D-erythritol 4-phosphate cytidylyltransferase [Bacteroidales bacterium]